MKIQNFIVIAVEEMAGIGKTTLVGDDLKRTCPDDKNKSRVIVTSGLYNVANHASTTYPHTLQFLDEEESWHLLREKVFGGERIHPLLNLRKLKGRLLRSATDFL
ncbi:hypothetical protein Salat_1479500 [Sesamum alatum]|uniref:NB-ARC domain-containing protein n=1 Tax=Sesamum alatum TaxID=300844 RepID=A0AAE1YBA3_9LAMI|nr:hypothetical protein Salat_1479500 [Sesamum alatum]